MTDHLFGVVTRHGPCEVLNSSSCGEFANIGRLRLRNVVRSVQTICTAARLLARRRPLVYLAPGQLGPALLRDLILWVLALTRADQVVIHVHGCGFHRLGSSGPRLRRLLVRRLARRSHFILLSERYRSRFLTGIPTPQRLSYLPNAIPPTAERALAMRSAPRGHSPVARLLYVGAVAREKLWDGLEAILRSELIQGELERLNGRLQVVIAGKLYGRNAESEFAQICAGAGSRIEVSYLGGVFDPVDKGQLFASADGFILPTMHPTEGQPVALIEALCAGLPIIAFDTGLCGEAVTHRNGWLIPRGDLVGLQAGVTEFLRSHASNQLGPRRVASRSLFIERFSHESFERRLLEIVPVMQPALSISKPHDAHSGRPRA